MDTEKKLYKSNKNKMIDGVCGGIGEYFQVDPTLVRLGFALLCILAGGGILLYIVALIVMPRAPEGYDPGAAQNPISDTRANNEPATNAETASPEDGNSDGDDSPTRI